MTSALELTGVSRRFGSTVALDRASISVASGTIHALLGENGAGKTTLMRVAFGALEADAIDRCVVFGQPRTFRSSRDAISAGIGMVHQHPRHVARMTVAENVILGGTGIIDQRETNGTLRDLSRRIGFSLDPESVVGDLSVASQQRVEILKAAYRQARLLILDEPTAVLAPADARELYAWLRTFASGGGAAVVITHRIAEALDHADDVTVLRAGRTAFTGSTSATSRDHLIDAMLGAAPPAHGPAMSRLSGAGTVLVCDRLQVPGPLGILAIRDASFRIDGGELVGVVGLEGSGHQELLLAIADRVKYEGVIQRPSRLAFLPEDRHRDAVVEEFDLVENVAISGAGGRRGRIDWKALETATRTLVERFDIRTRGPRQPLSALSGGNQQKLVFAREISSDPQLLIAENPTRGLDIRAAAAIRHQLVETAAKGSGVIVYSSDLDEVMGLASRILVVHRGTVKEFTDSDRETIGRAMLGAQ